VAGSAGGGAAGTSLVHLAQIRQSARAQAPAAGVKPRARSWPPSRTTRAPARHRHPGTR
jgi:hypothetical protein